MNGNGRDGVLLRALRKTNLDFSFLATGETYERIVLDDVYAAPFHQAMLLVRLHESSPMAASQVDVILRQTDPSDEDGQDFVVSSPQDLLTVSVTDGTSAPALLKSPVTLAPGPRLRVVVRGTGGTIGGGNTNTYTVSADLLLRKAPDLVVEVTRHNFNSVVNTLVYVPINTTAENATITTLGMAWLAPADGELAEVVIMSSASPTTAGITFVGLHTNGSTTPVETQTVVISVANTPYVATFSAARFNKGDRLHISVDPANVPQDVIVVCRWRYTRF